MIRALILAFALIGCSSESIRNVDMKPVSGDMVAAQPDLVTLPALVSVSPATVLIGADTVITIMGSNCHFDTWCAALPTSFSPCVLNSFSSKVKDANTIQYTLTVPSGAQPTNCNISVQPRLANSGGGCGANASAPLSLSPGFVLK